MNTLAEDINILGRFCGIRDIPVLNSSILKSTYGIDQADVMVLFGGCIISGGDVLGIAMKNNIAKKYVIVGGRGHTTESLVKEFQKRFDNIDSQLTEAELFSTYIHRIYGLSPDYIEKESTNCGNNITNLLLLLEKNRIKSENIILVQDSTMQRRMNLTMKKYAPEKQVINYAGYEATIKSDRNKDLIFSDFIEGMWDVDRYVSLLLGEILRMTDNESGYGPKGSNYIAHQDIPTEIKEAFERIVATQRFRTRNKI